MGQYRVSIYVLGLVILVVGAAMIVPLLVSLGYGEDDITAIAWSSLITLISGAIIAGLTFRRNISREIHHRQAFLIAGMSWVLMGIFGSLPFLFYEVFGPISWASFTNSMFESVSGFTTTGSSVIPHVEGLPHGLLFWRSFSHWIGGLGIVMLSLAVLPFLGAAGMQLYRTESSLIPSEKLRPRIIDVARILWRVYLVLTAAEILLLVLGKMPLFDSICHTFATVSTGGFSIKDQGIMYYHNSFAEWVIAIFMVLGGTNFSLLFLLLVGKPRQLLKNGEFRFYLWIIFLGSLFMVLAMYSTGLENTLSTKIRHAFFSIASISSTTGFSNSDWSAWGSMAKWTIILCLIIGGCTGSTAGGIRVIRFLVTLKQHVREGFRLIHPHSVVTTHVGEQVIPRDVLRSMSGYVILYLFVAFIGTWLITNLGIAPLDAFSGILASMANEGPGLGVVGPMATYASIPLSGKWVFLSWMIIGRVEIFTILILLTPEFWRR